MSDERSHPDPNATGAYDAAAAPTPAERFAPGAVLAGRYRIVAALGKGGMGEVYRADDLTLGQPVALKFLPPHLADDPDRLMRFRKEVAVARKVSHPNCCRVYDLGEHAGQPFLAMEYIDGEDLVSALRRFGRLPEERAIAVARELCQALAAVHEQGLLHRDLKPANVMLDGRGKVRLTDFGLAAAAADIHGTEVRSGTPQYMAPEQLAGQAVTMRSDLFALGLVLYELFTGKKAFAGTDRTTPPSKPSSHVSTLDPAVERVILRCLDSEPTGRPRSALEVLAGLPDGDPLQAALAAGETPAPQVVADAGGTGIIPVRRGLLAVAAVILSLLFQAAVADRIGIQHRAGITTPPAEMNRKARQLIADLGVPDEPADAVGRYMPNWDWINAAALRDPQWVHKAGDRPGGFVYFYRQSPEPLIPGAMADTSLIVTRTNPPPNTPGVASVLLDPRGRLAELRIVPRSPPNGPLTGPGDDWAKSLFQAAELDATRFVAADPLQAPPLACDRQAAWIGTWAEGSDTQVRLEAAAYRGQPVWFKMDLPAWGSDRPAGSGYTPAAWSSAFTVGILVSAGALAWRNVRRGRGDRVTARRLWQLVAGWVLLSWVVSIHHPVEITALVGFAYALGTGIIAGGMMALLYLALEPAVRRRWPWRLTAWTRLFAGRWRDPMVGRDLLVGIAAAALALTFCTVTNVLGEAAGVTVPVRDFTTGGSFPPLPLFAILADLIRVVGIPLVWLFVTFCIFLVVRRERFVWVALVGLWCTSAAFDNPVRELTPPGQVVFLIREGLMIVPVAILVLRFGLLSVAGFFFGGIVMADQPLTFDSSLWYFPQAAIGAGVLVAGAAFCCWTATGGNRLIPEGFFGDE
jgi:serine/threonine-protein kinase